jgi:DNA invertase Pin-like site-specific DNA recombinase
MLAQGDHSVTAVAKAFGVGRTTLYRHLGGGGTEHQTGERVAKS